MNSNTPTKSLLGQLQFRLLALTFGLLLTAVVTFADVNVGHMEQDLRVPVTRNLATIGRSVSADINRALGYGIPLSQLQGMTPFLRETLKTQPIIVYLAVLDGASNTLFEAGSKPNKPPDDKSSLAAGGLQPMATPPSEPTNGLRLALATADGGTPGALLIVTKASVLEDPFVASLPALIIGGVVALFIALMVLGFILNRYVSGPVRAVFKHLENIQVGDFRHRLDPQTGDQIGDFADALNRFIDKVNHHFEHVQKQLECLKETTQENAIARRKQLTAHAAQLLNRVHFAENQATTIPVEASPVEVRAPLFLLLFAEEISRPFLPQLAGRYPVAIDGLDQFQIMALPLSAFFLCLVIGLPLAGLISGWLGSRRLLLIGAVVAAVGFVGTAVADHYDTLILWRSVTALAFALILVAYQKRLLCLSQAEDWTRAMTLLLVTAMAGGACGAAVGGVLADRMDLSEIFYISALFIGGACFLLFNSSKNPPNETAGDTDRLALKGFFSILGNYRLLVLLLFGAVPANLMLTGFVFYLLPITFLQLGLGYLEIGLALALYFGFVAIVSPIFAWLAETGELHLGPVVVGGLMTCSGALVLWQWQNAGVILIALVVVGFGQAMGTAPLLSMAGKLAKKQIAEYGQATVLSAVTAVQHLGSIAGPLAAAVLYVNFGYGMAIAMLGLLVLVGVLTVALVYVLTSEPADPENLLTG